MKYTKFILSIVLISMFAVAANAQDLGKIDATVQKQIGASLMKYYALKNSLVASNLEKASESATQLLESLKEIDSSKMTDAQKTLWEKLKTNLNLDAEHIRDTKELEHQRSHFGKLSSNMYALVFNFKANETESYLFYCPMKKTTWLSEKKDVENPYMGQKMLDCGSVRNTLKKNN